MIIQDRARWEISEALFACGVAYEPPGLGLMYKDGAAGRAIFEELRQKLGPNDEHDRLRISIITGIDKENPADYSLVVGTNLPADGTGKEPREFISVSRIHRMRNPDTSNLKSFEDRVSRTKRYGIFPTQMPTESNRVEMFGDLAILKRTIRIIPAWQSGENDLDSPGIGPDDDPIIPPDAIDVPVRRLIDRRKRRPLRRL